MEKFRVGMRIVVTESSLGELYPNGTIGEIITVNTELSNHWWVKFEEGSGANTDQGNFDYRNQTGDNNYNGVWTLEESEMEPYEIFDMSSFIETGRVNREKEEWKPDELREDIDVMKVTEELVSVEVGK